MSKNEHNLLTVKEAADFLRIPLPTTYYLLQRGQIPGAVQIGGRWRIRRQSLRSMLGLDQQTAPLSIVLVNDVPVNNVLCAMLRRCGYTTTDGPEEASLIVCDKDNTTLDVLEALQDNQGASLVMLHGEPCAASLAEFLKLAPVTVISHPVQMRDIERMARMFGVQPQQMKEAA